MISLVGQIRRRKADLTSQVAQGGGRRADLRRKVGLIWGQEIARSMVNADLIVELI